MQANYDTPLTGNVQVSIETAQVISDFLLMILQLPDSPVSRDQMEQFSVFRDAVKAGPVKASRYDDKTSVLRDGIVLGDGPKCLIDRHVGLNYLRAMIHGEVPVELQKKLQVALLDAVASKGPKKNTGINGKFCQGTFGYVIPEEAKEYLSGVVSEITVYRAKNQHREMSTYFAETPNHYLRPDKTEWQGPKDHVKTKFNEEEAKNQ